MTPDLRAFNLLITAVILFLFRFWSRQKKKQSTSTEGWTQDGLSLRLAPLRHRKRGEQLALTLLLFPLPPRLVSGPRSCRLPQNTPALFSVSLSMCKQKLQECFFACSVGIFMNMWVVFLPFLLMPWYVLTQPLLLLLLLLLLSPFSNIKTKLVEWARC